MSRPTRIEILAACARSEVDGQALQWWLKSGAKVTAAVGRMQARGLIAPADSPPAGRVTAQLTTAGRDALAAAGRCRDCGAERSTPRPTCPGCTAVAVLAA